MVETCLDTTQYPKKSCSIFRLLDFPDQDPSALLQIDKILRTVSKHSILIKTFRKLNKEDRTLEYLPEIATLIESCPLATTNYELFKFSKERSIATLRILFTPFNHLPDGHSAKRPRLDTGNQN